MTTGSGGRRVPFVDLARSTAPLLPAMRDRLDRAVAGSAYTLGDELVAFESEFAEYCGSAHCAGVADGTAALSLALTALGAGPGTEVVTVPFTFIATVEAILATGAAPRFVDVDPETRCMPAAALEGVLGSSTAAVVPVHIHGQPAPIPEIQAVCGDIPVLEDAAQAHGARIGGRRAGSTGSAAAFSFYPTKNLGALGDGGAVVSDSEDLVAQVRSLRHHGSAADDPNAHVRDGGTARLDNLQAAFLRIKLPLLDAWNEERRRAAALYRELLEDAPLVLPPPDPPAGEQVYHLFAVEVDDRDRVRAALREHGIETGVHYPRPVHLQPVWRERGYGPGDFPVAEALALRVLSLPMFPGITEDEVRAVADALTRVLTGTLPATPRA